MSRRKIAMDKLREKKLKKEELENAQKNYQKEQDKWWSDRAKLKSDKRKVWADWGDKSRKLTKEKDVELSKGPKGIEIDKANDIMWYKKAVNDETRNANLQNIARAYSARQPDYAYEEPMGKGEVSRYLVTRNKLRKPDPNIVGYKDGGKVKKMKNGGRGGGKSKCRGGGKATQGTGFTYR